MARRPHTSSVTEPASGAAAKPAAAQVTAMASRSWPAELELVDA